MADEVDYRREILKVADQDAAFFLQRSLEGEDTGIPPPPVIEITETSADPVRFDVLGFGTQGAGTQPAGGGGGGGPGGPPGPERWACCMGLEPCVDNKTLFECSGL